jgi:hypothetical protein
MFILSCLFSNQAHDSAPSTEVSPNIQVSWQMRNLKKNRVKDDFEMRDTGIVR